MNAAEKIKDFESVSSLMEEIQKDRACKDILAQRYPVRFIMLDNFETFRELSNELTSAGIDTFPLETILEKNHEEDTWITTDELKESICSCTQSTMITPFSELARFYSDDEFVGFFNEIILHEDLAHPGKRIYIPLIGLKNRVEGFLGRFGRIAESAPIWRLNTGHQSVHVYLSKYKGFEIPEQEDKCIISNFREWLRFWKTSAPKPKIVCTALPIVAFYKNSKPDNIFTFSEIKNAYDFLTDFLDIHLPFTFKDEEIPYYEELLKKIDKTKPAEFSFDTFVRSHFNRVDINPIDILQDWGGDSTAFDRWLLQKYATSQEAYSANNPYFICCISQPDMPKTPYRLFEEIAQHIFYFQEDKEQRQYTDERSALMQSAQDLFRRYVSSSSQEYLRKCIIDTFQVQSDLRLAIELCTQTFDFEKRLAMAWYINYSKDGFYTFDRLAKQYPDLAAYLRVFQIDGLKDEDKWVVNYVQEYRRSKLRDEYSKQLSDILLRYNKDSETFYHWYWHFKNSHERLAAQNFDKIYWIDGLGTEYISLIQHVIEEAKSDFHIVSTEITRSNIPSSTSLNRFDGPNVVKFGALDELGHDSHHYQPFETLITEIQLVKKIILQIISDNKNTQSTIAIVSDHGMSALSRLCDSKKYSKDTEHEGRYIKVNDGHKSDDSDFISHVNETDRQTYIVALKHASLGSKPSHEVHGGCTPEEVLTPFIVISNIGNVVPYIIQRMSNRIQISNPVIKLQIIPKPEYCKLVIEDKEYDMVNTTKDIWETTLENPQEKTYSCLVKPSNGNVCPIDLEFYGLGFGDTDINDDFDI